MSGLARLALIAAVAFVSVFWAASSAAQDAAIPGRLLFVRNGSVWVWSNGDANRIFKAENASHARWSPDAKQFVYVETGPSYSDLVIHDISTEARIPLTFNQPQYQEGSPDYVAAAAWVIDPEWASVGIIGFMSDMQSPDGTMQIWLVRDTTSGAFLAPAAQFEDNIDGLSLANDASVAAYVVQQRQQDGTSTGGARLRDLNDGVAYQIADGENVADPAISPDAQLIAMTIRGDDGVPDIWITDRVSGRLDRVTRNANATNPVWSPDGRWLAFIRMVDFEFEVWAAPITSDGPGEPIKVFKAKGLDARSGLSWTFEPGG
jgi:TolB protein